MENDIVELSSDSDPDTTINYYKTEDDIGTLISKYRNIISTTNNPDLNFNSKSLQFTECNIPTTPTFESIPSTSFSDVTHESQRHMWYDRNSVSPSDSSSLDDEDCLIVKTAEVVRKEDTKCERSENRKSNEKTKRRKLNDAEKEEKKKELEAKKLEKIREREQRKAEVEKEKAIKKATKAVNKNLKPEECLKLITAHIDLEIVKSNFGKQIISSLQDGVTHRVQSQLVPNIITWTRKIQNYLTNDNGQLNITSENTEIDETLLLMDSETLINLIETNTLLEHIKSVQAIFENKKLYLCIYGLEAFFKNQKKKPTTTVTRKKLEFALTETQIFCNCSHRLCETAEQVGLMVAQFTKAIALAPYKAERNSKYEQSDWYIAGDNKDCVRVDKDGNGLKRLWNQQLCSFPLARLETSEAIVLKYPTPRALIEAYESCDNKTGQELLQDIPVRRAAGPLSSTRKIGPELSKKIHTFFTTINGETLL